MGRFQWGQGHLKQSSDKLHEWFTRENGEPSRLALGDLLKDQTSFESTTPDESPKHGRSRTNTVTSSFSAYARSVSDASNEYPSRPSSQLSFAADTGMPMAERQENGTRHFLSKSTRMLKRQGSKLTLLPSQLEEKISIATEGRPLDGPSTKTLHRQSTLSKRPGAAALKNSISGPYGFQHVTHTEQSHFQSLDTVTKGELESSFSAIQNDQHPVDQIKGIPVEDLPPPVTLEEHKEPTSPTTNAIPLLPTTPTRPQPPPKDRIVSPRSPSDIRLSRSMENFSRPTRLSVSGQEISLAAITSGRLSALSPIIRNSVQGKPLPMLPDADHPSIVHAVSTRDDVALPMRTAPLPSPPNALDEVPEEEETVIPEQQPTHQASAISPTQNPVRLPVTPKERKRRSQSSGEIDFDAMYSNVLSMVTEQPSPEARANRLSKATKRVSIEDWEDAIDYSWDQADMDVTDGGAHTSLRLHTSNLVNSGVSREKLLVVEQNSVDEASSSASTPLMMHIPTKPLRLGLEQSRSCPNLYADEPSSPLLGLGIDSLAPVPAVSLGQRETQKGESVQPSANDTYPLHLQTPNSFMSKSSSQESIILSIASSVGNTHRSSNSSTTFSDFAHLANFSESMDKLDQQVSPAMSSKLDQRNRESSQDTIRKELASEKLESTMVAQPDETRAPLATKHDRVASASQISIPERTSSIPAIDGSKTPGRKRAGTLTTTRPRRNTRVSYSLFPTTPSISTAPGTAQD